MAQVSFKEFIAELEASPEWTLDMSENGITLGVVRDGVVAIFLSPNPKDCNDRDWGQFLGDIADALENKDVIAQIANRKGVTDR